MSIKVENLSFVYAKDTPLQRKALDDICLEIKEGDFLGIAGHTGSGKSTLVQHLNGLLKPTWGKINVDGLNLTDKNVDLREIRKKVGLVFQYPEHQLFEETVFQDVAFGPRNLAIPEVEISKIVKRVIEWVGLEFEAIRDLNPFQLSGGQMRRVAIAGVLALQPKYLVLDEPTAGLDPKGRQEILSLIKRLNVEEGMTIILVSHSMDDLANYARDMIVMDEGKILLKGRPKEVFTERDLLTNIGLDVPTITQLMFQLKVKGFPVKDGIVTFKEGLEEIKRVLGGKPSA